MAVNFQQALLGQTDTGIPGVSNRQQPPMMEFGSLTGMTPPQPAAPAAAPAPALPMPQRAEQQIASGEAQLQDVTGQQEAATERFLGRQRKGLADVAAGEQRIKGEYGTAVGQALEEFAPMEAPTFQPSKDDVTSLMGLFGLVSTVGFLTAGEGRYGALAALQNMEGMMKGYQKGRADLFTREAQEFEKNLKKVETDNRSLKDRLERALQKFAIDRDAALAELEPIKAELKGSALEFEIRNGQFNKAMDRINKSIDGARQTLARWDESRQKFEERAILQTQMLEGRRDIAQLTAALNGGQAGGLKPSAEVSKAYVADNVLANDLRELTNMLEQSPTLRQKVTSDRLAAFLSEKNETFAQVFQTERDPEVRRFLQRVADMRNNYFLTISGKAVTVQEALRSYGAVPQPGDSPEAMIDKMRGMERRVDQKVALYRQMYPSLPQLDASVLSGQPSGFTEADANQTFPIAPQESRPSFDTIEEAEAANLPKGTRIIVGGKSMRVD